MTNWGNIRLLLAALTMVAAVPTVDVYADEQTVQIGWRDDCEHGQSREY